MLGSGIAGRLTNSYGRKKILLIVAVLFAITSLATGLAPSFALFVMARFAGGLAVGGASILSPMYVAEVSPPSLRGRMGTLYQLSIVTGILISYGINYLLRDVGPANWRWMFITGVVPSILFFAMLLVMPETPRYLFMAAKEQQGFAILERIAGRESAEFEAKEIRASLQKKRNAWMDLLQPGIRRAVFIGFCLAVLVHVSGINTIIDYAPAILRAAGWKIDAALFSTFIIGITNLVFTCASFWVIDRYGRKPLYIIGSLGMTAALILLLLVVLDEALPECNRSGLHPGVSGFLLIVHWTRLLDTGSRDIPQRPARNRNGRAGTETVDSKCDRRSAVSACLQSDRQRDYVWFPRRDVAHTGCVHVVLCAGDEEQAS